ncbi:hypothetical protein GGQ99_004843 [Aminobacter niigataensis]|uniref:Uncharacterized protein n=1 Tax=Aminobacter niigataensis TaxID=83265 RepID=A0ABR6L8C2_9HYPH|nr:hypothetical protein [Aminobacter niigataensis]MBB4653059.1 hypothetical protein [Aminobacter niigataensis]
MPNTNFGKVIAVDRQARGIGTDFVAMLLATPLALKAPPASFLRYILMPTCWLAVDRKNVVSLYWSAQQSASGALFRRESCRRRQMLHCTFTAGRKSITFSFRMPLFQNILANTHVMHNMFYILARIAGTFTNMLQIQFLTFHLY